MGIRCLPQSLSDANSSLFIMIFSKNLLAILLLTASGSSHAVIKCVSPNGQVVYQDFPCEGSRNPQQVTPSNPDEIKIVVPNPWSKSPKQAQQLMSIYRRWIDAEKLAIASNRLALTTPIASLQAIQREIEVLRVPECLEKPKLTLYKLISQSTNSMLVYMSEITPKDFSFFTKERGPLIKEFERSLRFVQCDGYDPG